MFRYARFFPGDQNSLVPRLFIRGIFLCVSVGASFGNAPNCVGHHSAGGDDAYGCVPMEIAMQTYDDLVELARVCARNSYAADNKEASAEFWKMATEYRARAAKLKGSVGPDVGKPPPWLGI